MFRKEFFATRNSQKNIVILSILFISVVDTQTYIEQDVKNNTKDCFVNGQWRKHAETFSVHFTECMRCWCYNARYGCNSPCPQKSRRPMWCPTAVSVPLRLPNITCCRQWICPKQRSFTSVNEISKRLKPRPAPVCETGATRWNPCSKTCGFGHISRIVKLSNCSTKMVARICYIRPCEDSFPTMRRLGSGSPKKVNVTKQKRMLEPGNCSPTQRMFYKQHIYSVDGKCVSVKQYRLKICSNCKKNKCCTPKKTKQRNVTMTCDNSEKMYTFAFDWIKKCTCRYCDTMDRISVVNTYK